MTIFDRQQNHRIESSRNESSLQNTFSYALSDKLSATMQFISSKKAALKSKLNKNREFMVKNVQVMVKR